MDAWVYPLLWALGFALVFVLFSSPFLFRFTRFASKRPSMIATPEGRPTWGGLALHALMVFTVVWALGTVQAHFVSV
jgi:hypothetical protein